MFQAGHLSKMMSLRYFLTLNRVQERFSRSLSFKYLDRASKAISRLTLETLVRRTQRMTLTASRN
jgi:hypothetical protein